MTMTGTRPAGRPSPDHPVRDEPAIRTRGLTKHFGRRTVVDGLDIDVPYGVVAGFLGPNGAGKTTTLRMLLGLVRPNSGEGTVLGADLRSPARYLGRVGSLIEGPAFYPSLSGERNLTVQAILGGHDRDRIPAVLERVGLADRGDDAYRTYSMGMKQRLGIAGALLGAPSLLVLDEPTNGLDPNGIRQMRDLIRSLSHDGPTVFVSSHLLSEVQQMCDWLVMIDHGRRLYQGPMAELLAGKGEVVVAAERAADLPRLAEVLTALGYEVRFDGDRLRCRPQSGTDGAAAVPATARAEINRAAAGAGITLVEVAIAAASLEERYQALLLEETP
jgi:ABC-2 type transport system ATP-binding protein